MVCTANLTAFTSEIPATVNTVLAVTATKRENKIKKMEVSLFFILFGILQKEVRKLFLAEIPPLSYIVFVLS